MKNKVNLSVVIPTYNRSGLVERAIHSVLNQNNFEPLEIIILDDASTDNTETVINDLKTFSPIPLVFFRSPSNVGPSKLRNLGIKMAKGDFVGFLDSDDVWTSNKLKLFVSELEKRPDLNIWTHKYGVLEEHENIIQFSETVPFWKQLLKNHASCPCTIIRRNLNQLFSEDLKYNEDHELFTRIAFQNELVLNHSVLTLLNRKVNDAGGLSGEKWSMRKGEIKTYFKAAEYNKSLIYIIPFLVIFSLLKHVRLMLRSI